MGSSQLVVVRGDATSTTSPVVQILAGATVLGSETLITRFDLTGNPTTVNGTLLLVSDSTVSNLFTLVDFENGLLTTSASTATTPLVILNNSDVTTSGPTVGLFGGNVQIQGTLLEATNTVITTPSAVLFVGFSSVLDDIAAAPSATPLVLITDSSICSGSVVEVDGSGSAINLQRPLLVVDPSTIDTGSLLLITNLGAVTSTATSSFVQLSDVTVTATQELVA